MQTVNTVIVMDPVLHVNLDTRNILLATAEPAWHSALSSVWTVQLVNVLPVWRTIIIIQPPPTTAQHALETVRIAHMTLPDSEDVINAKITLICILMASHAQLVVLDAWNVITMLVENAIRPLLLNTTSMLTKLKQHVVQTVNYVWRMALALNVCLNSISTQMDIAMLVLQTVMDHAIWVNVRLVK